jgi:hypothetical protein
MTRIESNTEAETPVWSAHHLPKEKLTFKQNFWLLAVAAGLIAVVVASAVKDPVRTTGTQMEPGRFTTTLQKADKAAPAGIVVADGSK